jgi:hypothetical protein
MKGSRMDDLELFMKELTLSGYKIEKISQPLTPEEWAKCGIVRRDYTIKRSDGPEIGLGFVAVGGRPQYSVWLHTTDDKTWEFWDVHECIEYISELIRGE